MWATVEVASHERRLHDGAEQTLADYTPQVGTSPYGWLTIQVRVPATNVAHATSVATALARAATGADAIGCHALTLEEHDRRQGATFAAALVTQRVLG